MGRFRGLGGLARRGPDRPQIGPERRRRRLGGGQLGPQPARFGLHLPFEEAGYLVGDGLALADGCGGGGGCNTTSRCSSSGRCIVRCLLLFSFFFIILSTYTGPTVPVTTTTPPIAVHLRHRIRLGRQRHHHVAPSSCSYFSRTGCRGSSILIVLILLHHRILIIVDILVIVVLQVGPQLGHHHVGTLPWLRLFLYDRSIDIIRRCVSTDDRVLLLLLPIPIPVSVLPLVHARIPQVVGQLGRLARAGGAALLLLLLLVCLPKTSRPKGAMCSGPATTFLAVPSPP
mmetsp:Transcript_11833/g.33807  ORF Transcript_11833/g.33807 Transcript_11833/m.33807 type:complete len:286 (+) Transcript_11833:4884-5741(+)